MEPGQIVTVIFLHLRVKINIFSKDLRFVCVCATGRGARFIGDMHGGESDEVSALVLLTGGCALASSACQSILM